MNSNNDIQKRRKSWLYENDPYRGFEQFFDYLPGVSIFAKDRDCVFMRGNKSFLQRFDLKEESELIGKTDHDFVPSVMVEHFRNHDLEVMAEAQPKLNIIETFFNRQGLPDWFLTHKLPIFSKDNKVIGIMGITKSHKVKEGFDGGHSYERLAPAIEYLRAHFRERIDIEELAGLTSLSLRQFDRVFKEYYGLTPQKFLIKTRVQAACEALRREDVDLANLAIDLGFYDQSSFTLHFRRNMGITPGKFRKEIISPS